MDFKIIDFEVKGNQVKFYIGTKNCNNYTGDDWNDTPYEHNAGPVYDRFIAGWFVKSFDFDDVVMEPCDGKDNSRFCKDDMKARRVPCICVLPKEFKNYNTWYYDFEDISNNANSIKFFFGDAVDIEKEDIHFINDYQEEDLYVSFAFNDLTEKEKKVVILASNLMSDTIKSIVCDNYFETIEENGFENVEKFIQEVKTHYNKYLKIASSILGITMNKKPVSRLLNDKELTNEYYFNQFICYKSNDCFAIGKIITKYNYNKKEA